MVSASSWAARTLRTYTTTLRPPSLAASVRASSRYLGAQIRRRLRTRSQPTSMMAPASTRGAQILPPRTMIPVRIPPPLDACIPSLGAWTRLPRASAPQRMCTTLPCASTPAARSLRQATMMRLPTRGLAAFLTSPGAQTALALTTCRSTRKTTAPAGLAGALRTLPRTTTRRLSSTMARALDHVGNSRPPAKTLRPPTTTRMARARTPSMVAPTRTQSTTKPWRLLTTTAACSPSTAALLHLTPSTSIRSPTMTTAAASSSPTVAQIPRRRTTYRTRTRTTALANITCWGVPPSPRSTTTRQLTSTTVHASTSLLAAQSLRHPTMRSRQIPTTVPACTLSEAACSTAPATMTPLPPRMTDHA